MTSIVVGKSRISLLESERYVAGAKRVYKIQVSFSDDWQDLDKKVIFKNDCFEIGVDVRNQSETFPIPSELFVEPSNKLQVGAYGYVCGKCDQAVLNTKWASLGRVSKGAITSNCNCGCNPPVPTMPSPVTYDILKQLIDRKADRLTYEDGMFILWSEDEQLSSFESPLGIPDGGEKDQVLAKASDADGDVYWRTVSSTSKPATMLKVPLGAIQIWSGSIDDIPESYSLCDGQNGTPDLRYAMVVGASESIEPGTVVYGPEESEPMPIGRSARNSENRIRYYALAFIQKTSFTEADMKEANSAYEIAVSHGFEGTEEEWLASLNGLSAYDIAKQNGFKGTETEWLSSLHGTPGEPGAPGRDGKDGKDGRDGVDGRDGRDGIDGKNGRDGVDGINGKDGVNGKDGKDGKSAYEFATESGYSGTEKEFADILSLHASRTVCLKTVSYANYFKQGSFVFSQVIVTALNGDIAEFPDDIVYIDKKDPRKMVLTSLDNTVYQCNLDNDGNIVSIERKTMADQIKELVGESGGTVTPGVLTFNGRKGDVVPQAGDYNASMVGAVPITTTINGKPLSTNIVITKDDIEGLKDGASAYEIAVKNGFSGTEAQWLESLKGASGTNGADGADGKSAYEVAVQNGFVGSEAEWLTSLKGDPGIPGDDGLSAYEIAVNNGFTGTQTEWVASLKGEKGENGTNGENGKSAYQIAVDNGYTGTEQEWLQTFSKGEDGKSAYQIAVDNGYTGTEAEWLTSLKGEKGETGANGSSAYDVAVTNGFEGTEAEWLASLHGKSVQSIQDYSTGETLVGRWIDNRPVYRRVIKTTVVQSESVVTVATIPGIELASAITGMIAVQNGSRWCSIPGTDQGTDYGVNYNSGTGNIELYASYISEESRQLQLIIEYVKIGDDALTDDQLVVNPGASTSDHRLLTNRDAEDQHPISSISMLSDQLNATPKESITDEQLNALFM